MTTETIFNLYLDANLFLIVAALIWIGLTHILRRTDLRYAHTIRLRAAYALLIAVAALPFALQAVDALAGARAVTVLSALSLSDFAVAQFLDGRFDVSPTAFEAALNLRNTFVRDVVELRTGLGQGVALLLAIGFGATMLRLVREITRITRVLRTGYRLRRNGRVDIVLSDLTAVPFSTRSLRRQIIVVPTEILMRPKDLRIAVSHELQHIRQGDVTWEVVLELLRPLFFWNPAFAYWKREIEVRRELACDGAVLSRSSYGVAAYSACLLRACERALGAQGHARLATPSVPFAQSTGRTANRNLVSRFEMLIRPQDCRNTRWSAALFAPMALVVLLTGLATHASPEWSHDRIMLSTIVNLERLDSRTVSATSGLD